MRIGIVVGHPTQFEAPFYRFVSQHASAHSLQVYFWNRTRLRAVYDPEIGRDVDWGIDLTAGYSYRLLPERRLWSWFSEELKRQHFDLLIVNGYNRPALLIAAAVARLTGTRVALRLDSVWGQGRSLRNTAKKYSYPLLFRLFDHFFVTSSRSRAYLHSLGIEDRKISFFTYAVDQDWFRSLSTQARENPLLRCEFGLPLDRRVIIAVSKLAPRETPWDLLRAMADPISGSPHLLLAGDGPDKSAVEEFTQKYCGGSVTLAGYVKYSRLAEVYAAGDVFIHCSANEPYGVSVAEALSCGLSVITSSGVGSGYDLIRPSQNGFVYSHGDVSALRACIEAALSLDRRSVEAVNERVLKAWDYGSTWSNILSALEPAER